MSGNSSSQIFPNAWHGSPVPQLRERFLRFPVPFPNSGKLFKKNFPYLSRTPGKLLKISHYRPTLQEVDKRFLIMNK
jgi:hypothetical protein